jgi:tetratricopeptide (TPR) repeat protein
MPPFLFEWSLLGTDGLRFQELCRDLFKREELSVHITAPGGQDRGRDLEIFRPGRSHIGTSGPADWWVECKSRTSAAGVNLKELGPNFICAIVESIPRLIFITNSHLTNEARDIALRFNTMKPRYLATSVIERDQLENWIETYPDIYVRYFAPGTDPQSYPPPTSSKPVEIRCTVDTIFLDDEPRLIAHARNLSLREQHAVIRVAGTKYRLKLDPLDEIIEEIAVQAGEIAEPELDDESCPANIQRVTRRVEQFSSRIDRIFVDPHRYVDAIHRTIESGSHLYLGGTAGMGKTRLLREAARRARVAPRTIDLSFAGYRYSLAEHLLIATIGLEIPILELLSREAIEAMLARAGCDTDVAAVIARFAKHDSEGIDAGATVGAIVTAFEKLCRDRVLFLDNIHRFSALDLQVFERLLRQKNTVVVCSARGNEVEIPSTAYAIEEEVAEGRMVRVDLEPYGLRDRVRAFLDAAAADDGARAFLGKYAAADSFHALMLGLKELRMLGVISQDRSGRIEIARHPEWRPIEHERAYQALMRSVRTAYQSERVESILQLAAAYDFAFPDVLLTTTLGGSCADMIDRLILDEIFVEETGSHRRIPGVKMLRFDHELTRELIYEGTPPMRRKRWHEAVATYLEALGAEHALFSPRLLSAQFEQLNDFTKAVSYSNMEAQRQIGAGRLSDAYSALERSRVLVDDLNSDPAARVEALEADTLIALISVGLRVHGTAAMKPRIEQLAVNLTIAPDEAKQAVLNEYTAFVQAEKSDVVAGIECLDQALATYERLGDRAAYARALNTKGNFLKRAGAPAAETLRLHRDVLRRFRALNDPVGAAEALGDLGAVLLEHDRGWKTVFWWKKSAEILQSTSDRMAYCYHLTDYAYIRALFRPGDPDNVLRLKAALSLARKLDLQPFVCRALINLANFTALSQSPPDLAAARRMIAESIELAHTLNDRYLELLARFSDDVFSRASGVTTDERDRFLVLLNEYTRAGSVEVRDNRLVNIAKYATVHLGASGRDLIARFPRPDLEHFRSSRITVKRLDAIEARNPYYRNGGLYVTYY